MVAQTHETLISPRFPILDVCLMIMPPDPHPLDFDWRYDAATIDRLTRLLSPYSPVLCMGTPSVARQLEARGCDVTLLDRQPFQGVTKHVACDPRDYRADRTYRAVLADPPWYPYDVLAWTAVAARAVRPGAAVFLSLWPEETRPGAQMEAALIFQQIAKWGNVERRVAKLHYEAPAFETRASQVGGGPLSHSPLCGELVRIEVRAMPSDIDVDTRKEQWLRFVFNDYQLALKMSTASGPALILPIDGAVEWRWPFVSARAPKREKIDLWSSEGEVASVYGPAAIATMLRELGAAPDHAAFNQIISQLPALRQWNIPRPPYRRFAEWQHQQ